MAESRLKICLYGAGVVGGIIAARLAALPDVEVSIVARGAHLDAIQRQGLRVSSPDSDILVRVKATERAETLGQQDYVFVTLKAHQLEASLSGIAALMGPKTAVLPPTTGIPHWYFHGLAGPWRGAQDALDPGGRLTAVLPPAQMLGAVYFFGGEMEEPGHITRSNALPRLPIGEPDGSRSERVLALADVLSRAGFDAPVAADIRAWIWKKLISSLSWNPVAVLTGATVGAIGDRPQLHDIVARMMTEADAVAEYFGVRDRLDVRELMGMALRSPSHRMSMLQDVERGRAVEADSIYRSIVAMREIAGARTPLIDDIYALLDLKLAGIENGAR